MASPKQQSTAAPAGSARNLSRLVKALNAIRTLTGYSDMGMQMAVFLIECAGQSEASLQEIQERAGVSQSAGVRIHQKLGAGRPTHPDTGKGFEGLGLVEVYPDPYYQRRSMVRLTPKGQKFIIKLLEVIA